VCIRPSLLMPRWPSSTWSPDVQEIAGTQFGSSEISAFVTPKPRPPLVHLGADIILLGLFMHACRRLWMVSGAGPGVTAQESDSWGEKQIWEPTKHQQVARLTTLLLLLKCSTDLNSSTAALFRLLCILDLSNCNVLDEPSLLWGAFCLK
jgi:hypothetical protein